MPRITDVEERRHQILRAAVTVFGERGYSNATISDIASTAGLAHGTVYIYFKSKTEIFQCLVSSFVERLISDVSGEEPRSNGDGSLACDLYRMLHGALTGCAQYSRLTAVCMREAVTEGLDVSAGLREMESMLRDRVSARIARAIGAGEARSISPEFAGYLVVKLLVVAIQQLLELGADADVERLAREMVDFIMVGLGSNGPGSSRLPVQASPEEETALTRSS